MAVEEAVILGLGVSCITSAHIGLTFLLRKAEEKEERDGQSIIPIHKINFVLGYLFLLLSLVFMGGILFMSGNMIAINNVGGNMDDLASRMNMMGSIFIWIVRVLMGLYGTVWLFSIITAGYTWFLKKQGKKKRQRR